MVAEKVRSSRQLLVCEYSSTEDGTAAVKFLGWKFISSIDIIKQWFDSALATKNNNKRTGTTMHSSSDENVAYIRPIVLQGFRSCKKNTCTGTGTGVPQRLQQSSVINVHDSGHLRLDEDAFKSYCLPLKCSTRVKRKAEHAASKYNRDHDHDDKPCEKQKNREENKDYPLHNHHHHHRT